MIINWKSLPPKHVLLDATNLIQFSMNQAMELAASESGEQQKPIETNETPSQSEAQQNESTDATIDTPMDSIEVHL